MSKRFIPKNGSTHSTKITIVFSKYVTIYIFLCLNLHLELGFKKQTSLYNQIRC